MERKHMNVASFNLDHNAVKAPYVRLADKKVGSHGDVIYKYDIRVCQPNREQMPMPALHSLEHLLAELMRNHSDKILDISPMGCQTGFYISLLNEPDYQVMLHLLETTLNDILAAEAVPACCEEQCGFAANHSLSGAQEIARYLLAHRAKWEQVF